jgi:hypothetical protein
MWSPTGVMSPISISSSVFEAFGEENKSGYLNMTGREGIFSPGHMDDSPFRYSPHMQKQRATEMELHQKNDLSSDNSLSKAEPSSTQTNIENPIYARTETSES